MQDNINLCKPIPWVWRVRRADSHVYQIGLSLYKPIYCQKRDLLHNPYLIFIIVLFKLIGSIINLYIHFKFIKLSPVVHLLLADMDYFANTGFAQNMLAMILTLCLLLLQILNFYNFHHGIQPMDMRVFQMISGFIAPKSLGIDDKILVHKFYNLF